MSRRPKVSEDLTKEQKKELDKLINDITNEAKSVVEDYSKNPSEISGSVVAVHEESPFIDERIPEDVNWKIVLKGMSGDEAAEIVKKYVKKKDVD